MEPASSPPRVLGRYALYDAIAAGGMATVHLGRLLGHVGFERIVAIKRLHPQFARDPEFVSMFLDEARVVGRIRHPNVIPTLDVVTASGELFIVMEYVQGESLARLIRTTIADGSTIPASYVATMIVGVLHGLHAAHEAGNERGEPLEVVHRDMSPQNILVGADGVARVLDFGVAKAVGRIQTTREGQLKGKLPYMAPEQISGSVGRTTDIYSVSVVMWEALTGRRLFSGDNEAHVMRLVLEGRVSPPSEIVPGIPTALDALVLRGLSHDPADRFQTAKEMALAIEEVMPTVAQSKIGAWVESAAAKTIHERVDRIALIESSASPHGTYGSAEEILKGTAIDPLHPTGVLPVETVATQLSSSSGVPGVRAAGSLRRAHPLFMIAMGASAIAIALSASVLLRRSPNAAPVSASAMVTSAAPAFAGSVSPAPPPPEVAPAPVYSTASPTLSPSVASASPRAAPRRWHPPAPASAGHHDGLHDGTSDRK